MRVIWEKWISISLILRITIGLVIGIALGVLEPETFSVISFFGTIFIGALQGVAPILVFFLVISAIAQHGKGKNTNMKHIIVLYVLSTFIAALVAVVASKLFPTELVLTVPGSEKVAPEGIEEVVQTLFLNAVDNPINSIISANYIGILVSAVLFGITLKNSAESTKTMLNDVSIATTKIVKWVIELAPFGIMGLVFSTVAVAGFESLNTYSRLIYVLVGSMLFVALVTNPLIVYFNTRKNPYPLVFKCLKQSGVTAFFTRSSAANIPVNMQLCEELGLDKETYAVSIPLGATINMAGAAITINILTLAAVHTLGIQVDFPTTLLLCVVSSVSACGASGVAGGSLLLIPLACSLFGISNEIAMQIVTVGFIVGVIQDSCETALNSSTDVLLTATAEYAKIRNKSELA